MDNETLASLLRGRNRAGQPVDATANIIGPAMSALGNTIYGAGRGALTAMAGLPGDINQLITDNLGTLVNAQGLPTTKDIQDFLPLKPTSYEGKLAQKLGEFVPVNPTPIAKGAVAIAKPVGKAMGEQAYRMTEDMLQKQGMMPSITTWHASPHKFEAFDASKVGTGEGAQSYGHGAGYVAENPKVAQEYYNAFTDIESAPLIFKGRKVDTPWNDDISQRWSDVIAEKKLSPSQIEDFQGILGNLSQVNNMQDVKSVVRDLSPTQLRMYKSLIEPELTKPEKLEAYMYKVDVSDKAIPKMLDWDKPIAEQKNLMNLLKKDAKKDSWVKDFLEMDLKDDPTLKGKDLYDKLKYKFNENQVEASKYLESKGVTGIKYLDAISRKEGGTSNFVPFNAENMKILERNNEPVDTLENVVAPLKEKGLTLDIYESKNNPNKLVLSKIEVPKELRKSGVGSNAMQELTGFADKQNKTITLSPSTDFGGSSVSRLKDFYKRFGFVENKGRYKDYSISESMYRLPTKLSRKDIIEEQVNNLK